MAAWQCVCGFKFGDTRASAAKAFSMEFLASTLLQPFLTALLFGIHVGSTADKPLLQSMAPATATEHGASRCDRSCRSVFEQAERKTIAA